MLISELWRNWWADSVGAERQMFGIRESIKRREEDRCSKVLD